MAEPLDEETTKALLIWIDQIELSRPKKNINRDFADGVLVAELIAVRNFRLIFYLEITALFPAQSRKAQLPSC